MQMHPSGFSLILPYRKKCILSISKEVLGESHLFRKRMLTSEFINLSPAVIPGKYIVYVHAKWKQGEVTYWFSISLE